MIDHPAETAQQPRALRHGRQPDSLAFAEREPDQHRFASADDQPAANATDTAATAAEPTATEASQPAAANRVHATQTTAAIPDPKRPSESQDHPHDDNL